MAKVPLKPPEEYLSRFIAHMGSYPHSTSVLRIISKTNCHRTTNGRSWGWYEIAPIGADTGNYWEGESSDLTAADRDEWNKKAASLCALLPEVVDRILRSEISSLTTEKRACERRIEELEKAIALRWKQIDVTHATALK